LIALVTVFTLNNKSNVMKERVSKLKQSSTQNLNSLCTCAQKWVAQQTNVGLSTLNLTASTSTLNSLS